MTGQTDPFDVQPRAPAQLHIDERERDRIAASCVEHVGEQTVARVIIIFLIACETMLAEDEIVERGVVCALALADARTRLQAQRKQPAAVMSHIKSGLLLARADWRR